jgi:hypothetical protein
MSEITLVLSDVDGTMTESGQHVVDPVVVDAVNCVEAQGTLITAVTGRPYNMMRDVLGQLGLKDIGVFDCGASLHKVDDGELVWKQWIERDVVEELVVIVEPHCLYMDYIHGFNIRKRHEIDVREIQQDAPYVFAFVEDEKLGEVVAQVREVPGVTVNVGPGHRDMPGFTDIQVHHERAGKYHGVNALKQIVHSDAEHTLAIGDSNNDIPLFENARLKVAMGNAIPELKALADYVVAPIEEHGFAEAMERFVLK